MNDLYIALVSGGLVLLGAIISSLTSYITDMQKQKMENLRYVRERKEKVYELIAEYILIETQSCEQRFINKHQDSSNEHLIKNIEIQLKLYAPEKIKELFYSTYEAAQAELPTQVLISRLDKLEQEIRKDICM